VLGGQPHEARACHLFVVGDEGPALVGMALGERQRRALELGRHQPRPPLRLGGVARARPRRKPRLQHQQQLAVDEQAAAGAIAEGAPRGVRQEEMALPARGLLDQRPLEDDVGGCSMPGAARSPPWARSAKARTSNVRRISSHSGGIERMCQGCACGGRSTRRFTVNGQGRR
jgi:hypothetical protein